MSAAQPASRLSLRNFRKDQDGTIAVLFGITLVPILLCAGVAIDYTLATKHKQELVVALDSTGLNLAHDAKGMSEPEFQARARELFSANYGVRNRGVAPDLTVSRTATEIFLRAVTQSPTSLSKIAGFNSLTVAASSKIAYASPKLEIALVLDNTGSMGWSGKMPALKAAATDFVEQLAAKAKDADQIKVSIVPFATQVRLDPATAGLLVNGQTEVDPSSPQAQWLDFGSVSNYGAWTASACVSDRPVGFDQDARTGARYPARVCAYGTQGKMIGLSDVSKPAKLAELKTAINAMTPSGNTNITIGLAWGQYSLTPSNPLGAAAGFGNAGVKKFIVLLTDGDNTANGLGMTASQINERTAAACASAKDPAKNTTVYTIRVIDGNVSLLRACASSPDKYFEAQNAAQIQPAFKSILDSILGLRVAG